MVTHSLSTSGLNRRRRELNLDRGRLSGSQRDRRVAGAVGGRTSIHTYIQRPVADGARNHESVVFLCSGRGGGIDLNGRTEGHGG